jgi:hypothetical protein
MNGSWREKEDKKWERMADMVSKTKIRGEMVQPNCRWKCVENAKMETGLTQSTGLL